MFKTIQEKKDEALSEIDKFQSLITDRNLREGIKKEACISYFETIKNKIKNSESSMMISIQYQRAKSYYQAIIKF